MFYMDHALFSVRIVTYNVSCGSTAQDRGPFWFSYILNKILEYIEIWNEFKVRNHCPNFQEDNTTKCSQHFEKH